MIDGLKVTISGTDLRVKLDERIHWHECRIAHYDRELKRTEEDQTEESPLLPEHMLEHERDEHRDRIEVLMLIRDHLVADETYRLGESDLKFSELIAQDACW